MSRSKPWPAEAKITLVALIVVMFIVVGLKPEHTKTVVVADLPPATSVSTSTTSPATAAAPTSSTTATTVRLTTTEATVAPTTVPAHQPQAANTPGSKSLATLNALPVANLDTSHAYDRTGDFGSAWTDNNNNTDGHNGCDTRNDILRRDLTHIVYRSGSTCVIASGVLNDPYSGQPINFVRGRGTSTAVQIDHLVPLHAAWELGAWKWSQQRRVDYANDPMVLLAASGPLNESKGDDLANEWLPPNTSYRCTYARKTVAVHHKYGLPVTPGEKATLVGIITEC